jgi:hypothetical protein
VLDQRYQDISSAANADIAKIDEQTSAALENVDADEMNKILQERELTAGRH